MRSLLTYHAGAHFNADVPPQKMGNGHPSIHPFRPYETSDGFLNICVGNDRIFKRLAHALDASEWAKDERFSTNPQRVAHREELNALLKPLFLQKSRKEWVEIMGVHGVPVAEMATIPEALETAELVTHKHPTEDSYIKSLPLPFELKGEPRAAERGPPLLGEHTEEVLREWLEE